MASSSTPCEEAGALYMSVTADCHKGFLASHSQGHRTLSRVKQKLEVRGETDRQ